MQYRLEKLIRRAAMIRARRWTSAPIGAWVARLENLDPMIQRFADIIIARKPALPGASWRKLIREAGDHVCVAVFDAVKARAV